MLNDLIRRGLEFLRARLRDPDAPSDPYAPVRHPRGVAPAGRHSAIALDEPREYDEVRAIGSGRERHS